MKKHKLGKKIDFTLKGVFSVSKADRYKSLNQKVEDGQLVKKTTSRGTSRYKPVK